MSFSVFGLIFLAVIVIGVGMGALALLAMVIKALSGRGKSKPVAKTGAWSGLKSAIGISAGLVAILVVLAALTLMQFRRSTRTIETYQQATFIETTAVDDETIRGSKVASETGGGSESGTVTTTSSSTKPAIEVAVEVNDDSTISIGVDTSATPANSDNPAQDAALPATVVDAGSADAAQQRKVQLEKMVAGIGEFLRSQLEKVGDKSAATMFGQAAKSDNGDVVIFQPSDEMVQQMLGAGGQDLLKSLNSELPGRIRQTYALIPLTPIGRTVPMPPLIANGGLEMLANSIVSLAGRADAASSSGVDETAAETAALAAEADGTLTVAPELRPEPAWMSKTEGRRLIAKTKPVFPGDDSNAKLTEAINEALAKHVDAVAESINPAMLGHSRHIHMELPQAIANKYIVDQYERPDAVDSEVNGKTPFKLLYALVEFPDTIDQIAVRQIRYAMQKDRIIGLGVVITLIWSCVCSAGFGIRQWQKGTKLRRIAATPVFALITIPALLLSVAMVFALAYGDLPRGPWNDTPVTIDLDDVLSM